MTTKRPQLDKIVRANTAFASFDDLLNTPRYRPSICIAERPMLLLADEYDAAMKARGDGRRAFRWGGKPLSPGSRGLIWVNQAYREADVIEVRNGKALIGYEMPSGREYRREYDANLSWQELRWSEPEPKHKTLGEKAARKAYPDLFGAIA